MKNVTKSLLLVFAAVLISWNATAAFAQKPIDIAKPDDTSDMHSSWELPPIDESMTVKQCIAGAKKGKADAQIELALRYFDGKGVKKDSEKALDYALKSAMQGNGKALYFLSCIEVNVFKSQLGYSYVKLAAEKGYVLAQVQMGMIKYTEGDYAQSYQWHLKAAKQGYLQSCYECGLFLLTGDGVEQNLEEAVRWYRIAAEGGHMRAQFELGICYANGEGVEQNYEEAIKWLSKSAEKNHPRSLYTLGVFYLQGKGVDPDPQKGMEYMIKASIHGSKDASEFLRHIQEQNDNEEDEEDLPSEQSQKAFG